jgi:bacterioferritin
MGQKGREIVKMDVDQLIGLLNKALSDEWLAYYQYWIGAKVVKGPMKDAVIAELNLHATEELAHATLLTTRIIQLGGIPVLKNGANLPTADMMLPAIRMLKRFSIRISKVNDAL